MPRGSMEEAEVARLLESCELIRIAFHDGDGAYLIPLGCVWIDGTFYGVTDPGHKTGLASANPNVAFQADTARETGLFDWESVTGQGEFTIVSDAVEKSIALAKLLAFVDTAPDWWKAEQGPRMAAGELLVWRIIPKSMTGVRYTAPS